MTGLRSEAAARSLLLVIILAAVALRVAPLLARYPLHRDEALYGSWARWIASGNDPLLLTAWIDKPPLVIYILAGSLRLLGVSELALRMPGMLASVVTVAMAFGLARQAYDRRTALLAAILCAASPFAILFAPTAFTDPWLTVWLLASAWAALAGRPFWSGLLLGLAVASKQQGVLAAPLVLGLMVARRTDADPGLSAAASLRSFMIHRFLPALAGFLIIFIPLTYWDSLRWAKRPSFWDRSLDTYGGLHLAKPAELTQRIAAWGGQLGYLYGRWPVTALVLIIGLLPGLEAIRQRRTTRNRPRTGTMQRVDLILLAYVTGYLALHVAVTFHAWDRYLLPIMPLVVILAARGMLIVFQRLERSAVRTVVELPAIIALAGILAWSALTGATGRLPVGSDHGAFDHLDQVVAFLRSRPSNAVVYHRSLGWYFDFYLFDAPQARTWWDSSWQLADLARRTARAEEGREQWLVLTGWEDPAGYRIPQGMAGWGLALREERVLYRRDGNRAFTVYGITPAGGLTTP